MRDTTLDAQFEKLSDDFLTSYSKRLVQELLPVLSPDVARGIRKTMDEACQEKWAPYQFSQCITLQMLRSPDFARMSEQQRHLLILVTREGYLLEASQFQSLSDVCKKYDTSGEWLVFNQEMQQYIDEKKKISAFFCNFSGVLNAADFQSLESTPQKRDIFLKKHQPTIQQINQTVFKELNETSTLGYGDVQAIEELEIKLDQLAAVPESKRDVAAIHRCLEEMKQKKEEVFQCRMFEGQKMLKTIVEVTGVIDLVAEGIFKRNKPTDKKSLENLINLKKRTKFIRDGATIGQKFLHYGEQLRKSYTQWGPLMARTGRVFGTAASGFAFCGALGGLLAASYEVYQLCTEEKADSEAGLGNIEASFSQINNNLVILGHVVVQLEKDVIALKEDVGAIKVGVKALLEGHAKAQNKSHEYYCHLLQTIRIVNATIVESHTILSEQLKCQRLELQKFNLALNQSLEVAVKELKQFIVDKVNESAVDIPGQEYCEMKDTALCSDLSDADEPLLARLEEKFITRATTIAVNHRHAGAVAPVLQPLSADRPIFYQVNILYSFYCHSAGQAVEQPGVANPLVWAEAVLSLIEFGYRLNRPLKIDAISRVDRAIVPFLRFIRTVKSSAEFFNTLFENYKQQITQLQTCIFTAIVSLAGGLEAVKTQVSLRVKETDPVLTIATQRLQALAVSTSELSLEVEGLQQTVDYRKKVIAEREKYRAGYARVSTTEEATAVTVHKYFTETQMMGVNSDGCPYIINWESDASVSRANNTIRAVAHATTDIRRVNLSIKQLQDKQDAMILSQAAYSIEASQVALYSEEAQLKIKNAQLDHQEQECSTLEKTVTDRLAYLLSQKTDVDLVLDYLAFQNEEQTFALQQALKEPMAKPAVQKCIDQLEQVYQLLKGFIWIAFYDQSNLHFIVHNSLLSRADYGRLGSMDSRSPILYAYIQKRVLPNLDDLQKQVCIQAEMNSKIALRQAVPLECRPIDETLKRLELFKVVTQSKRNALAASTSAQQNPAAAAVAATPPSPAQETPMTPVTPAAATSESGIRGKRPGIFQPAMNEAETANADLRQRPSKKRG